MAIGMVVVGRIGVDRQKGLVQPARDARESIMTLDVRSRPLE